MSNLPDGVTIEDCVEVVLDALDAGSRHDLCFLQRKYGLSSNYAATVSRAVAMMLGLRNPCRPGPELDRKAARARLKLYRQGLSFEEMAKQLGMSRAGIYEWCRMHATYRDDLARGEALGLEDGNQ